MKHGKIIGNFFCAAALSCLYLPGLTGCLDASKTEPFTIVTSALPNGTVGQPYSTLLSGSGGTPPYTWSVTPALPADLSLNATTGAITGTPTAEGASSHTFTLRDSTLPQQVIQKSLTLTINAAPSPLSITTTSLPDGIVGQPYSQLLEAAGGSGARTWTIAAGTLPQNLNLDPTTGVISGTPNAAGPSSFTVRVADTGGQEATRDLSILISPPTPPAITTTTLPGGTVGLAYSEDLTATGGTGTLVWSLSGGSLPASLTLSPAGTISGTPTASGTSNFSVRVTDALAQSDTQSLSIAISEALTITTTSLPNARVGRSYNRTLQRSGGVSPFTWSVTPALPDGLALNPATGAITGTPELGSLGTYSLTFTVEDSSTPTKQTDSRVLSLTVTL